MITSCRVLVARIIMVSDDGTATSSPSNDDCFFDEDDTNDSNSGNVNAALKIIINAISARFATARQTTSWTNGNNGSDQSCDLDSTNNSDSNMYSDEDDLRLPGEYISAYNNHSFIKYQICMHHYDQFPWL